MPKVRRSRKPPPDGWELIEPTLEELEQKMREGMLKCQMPAYYMRPHIKHLDICSRDGTTWGQTHHRIAVAHLQNTPPEDTLHLRLVLPPQGHQPRAVRLLFEGENCRLQFNSQMEEVRLWESMLPAMHPNTRHELWHQLHLPRA